MNDGLAFGTSGDSARWGNDYESLLYTTSALATQADDPALAPLLRRAGALLEDWLAIETDRRRLRGTAVAARARVAVADAALDHCLGGFAAALIAKDGEDSDLYRRCFPEPHRQVMDFGLDAELPAAMLIVAILREDEDLGASLESHATPLGQAVRLGNVVLTERAEAYAAIGRHQARVEAWLESAGAAEAGFVRQLSALAVERGLNPRWVACFFPPS